MSTKVRQRALSGLWNRLARNRRFVMPILQWALICNRVITDKETNSVSYIDALEAFAVSSFPIPFPPVCVSTLWRRESEEDTLRVRIRIQDPAGQTIQSFEPDQPTPLPKKRHRLNVILGGAEIREPGEFVIIIEQHTGKRWRMEHSLPIDVSQLPPVQEAVPRSRNRRKRSRVTKAVQQRHSAGDVSRRR